MPTPSKFVPLLWLHFTVVIWSLTAILGKWIELPTTVLVAWRTALAAMGLALYLRLIGQPLWPGRFAARNIAAVGLLIGLHWFFFFLAGKVGTVSAGLVGVSTCSLWCAFLEPIFHRGRKIGMLELGLSLAIIAGVLCIVLGDPFTWRSLAVGIAAGLVVAVFSFFNERLLREHDKGIITLYEMLGACLLMTVASVIFVKEGAPLMPRGQEWIWMLLLSQLCTVFAFTLSLALLRKLNVFTLSLVGNLEPVYGILLAAVFLAEHKALRGSFWLGSAIILAAVLIHPWLSAKIARRADAPAA